MAQELWPEIAPLFSVDDLKRVSLCSRSAEIAIPYSRARPYLVFCQKRLKTQPGQLAESTAAEIALEIMADLGASMGKHEGPVRRPNSVIAESYLV